MERADEPTQVGTPINKALFDELNGYGDLTYKYHTATIVFTKSGSLSTPTSAPTKGTITLNSTLASYEVGKRVLIDVINPTYNYTTNILTSANGFTATGGKTPENLIDGNDTTYATQGSNSAIITTASPYLELYPTTIRWKIHTGSSSSVGGATVKGLTALGNEVQLLRQDGTKTSKYWCTSDSSQDFDVTRTVAYTEWMKNLKTNYDLVYSSTKHYALESSSGKFRYSTSACPIYININGLGDKRITGDVLEGGKKYELIYDGTNFVAHRKDFEKAL